MTKQILCSFVVLALIAIFASPMQAKEAKGEHDRDWFDHAKYGVMFHFLSTPKTSDKDWQELVNQFDVEAVADQIEQVGADYLILTLGQNSGHYLAPNATYDRLTGYAPGTKCATRDLPAELHRALDARGIRLMLYIPASAPCEDDHAEARLGFDPRRWDPPITKDAADNWALVLREWSKRYEDRVAGWWMDGCYSKRFKGEREREAVFKAYSEAMKTGNPDALVAFNPGLVKPVMQYTKQDDFTAGEVPNLDMLPQADWAESNTARWHALTYLANTWGGRKLHRDTQKVARWIHQVNERGGVVTLDVGPSMDPKHGPVGTISNDLMDQLVAIRKLVRDQDE